ncbi:MAG: TetR/AcrR family transcriptional regulator [Jatrophihabitantaceae bacterium]
MAYRRTPQVQARLDAQRAGIVQAAITLVGESGYGACSMSRVAEQAGIASGTVYNHFAGKSDLLAEVFRVVVGREVEAVRAATATPGRAAERVTAVIETFAGRALKSPRLAYALLAEPVDAKVDKLRLVFRKAFTDLVATAVADGVANGELPPQNPALTASALVGAIGEVLVDPLGTGGAAPDIVPTVITFALRGMGVPDASYA